MNELAVCFRSQEDRLGLAALYCHHPHGIFPSIASIHKLEEHVPVVDARIHESCRRICEEGFSEQADISRCSPMRLKHIRTHL